MTAANKQILDKPLKDKPRWQDYRNERVSGAEFINPSDVHAYLMPALHRKHLPASIIFKSRRKMEALDIAFSIGQYFEICRQDLVSISRKREFVQARQIGMYIINKKYNKGMSLASIGNIYNRDHATVLHGISTIKDLIDTDRRFRHTIKELCDQYC